MHIVARDNVAVSKLPWKNGNDNLPFTQSVAWADILRLEGKEVEELCVVDEGVVVAFALVIYNNLPMGKRYAFCAKGPVGRDNQILENKFWLLIGDYLVNKGCVFLRVEPERIEINLLPNIKFFKSIDVNPRATTVLDLLKSEEDLLAAMHPKTRYNIRLAEKKNLRMSDEKNSEVFWQLMKKTAERDGFRSHGRKHYEAILASSASAQLTVYSGEVPVATAMFVGAGGTFTYLFGASDHGYRQLMAPYLVQWWGICTGKQRGYKRYDFFGIAPRCLYVPRGIDNSEYEYDPKHQYAGVTRFKLGFGGGIKEEPGTYDVVFSLGKYKGYLFLRWLRRLF